MRDETAQSDTKPLVMVVDDDPDLRMLAQIQLADDFEVLAIENGASCIELARVRQPSVIVLDMMMPEMNGAQVLEALDRDPLTRTIPVIFLSALSDTEDRVRGLEGGAVDWISKPYEARELRARVQAAARRSARELLKHALTHDPVTGLPTRASFEARLQEELARSKRNAQAFSILLIDVDALDVVNETKGKAAGDDLLGRVARLLGAGVRSSDACFRYQEDEFAVVLPDADVATAYLAAERLREAVGVETWGEEGPTLSIGIAEFSTGHSGEELLAKAKAALAKAKESGGNCSWRADDPRRHGINPLALSEELTQREWDILSHLAQRRTEQEIARRLGISSGTVRSHKARIRRKLHVDPDVRLVDFVKANFKHLAAHF
ncbi:MAG: diguanylate cyclase, partial [Actinomycetota bacterium]|nr:diguanylate cyclase [Actinomycetota bacterium]